MYTLTKDFHFSASHALDHLPVGHPCQRLHGHNYVVRVEIASCVLDDRGFVFDYNDLKPFGAYLDDTLDHRHLNDVLPVRPTAENMAKFLLAEARRICPFVTAVSVSETPKTWATYRSPN